MSNRLRGRETAAVNRPIDSRLVDQTMDNDTRSETEACGTCASLELRYRS